MTKNYSETITFERVLDASLLFRQCLRHYYNYLSSLHENENEGFGLMKYTLINREKYFKL